MLKDLLHWVRVGRPSLTVHLLACALLASLPLVSANAHFNDTFTRADAAAIGNGWIEKSADAFAITSGQVAKQAVASGYRDNIVYRPASEDVLNTEASLEFQATTLPPGYPQLFVRVQSSSAGVANVLDGYILFFENSGTAAQLSRQNGTAYPTPLATLTLNQSLNTTDRFRMRLSAIGTSPVQLAAYVERLVGNAWQVIGQANVGDNSATRIATAGSVGFGGYTESSYRFDNFARIDLGAVGSANVAPVATGIAPSSVNAGESGVTLIVYGSGFSTDSVVRINGSDRPTVYVSPTEVEATLSAADLAAAGSRSITVFNPTPGGGTSAAQTLQVITPGNPAPVITQLSPASATAGSSAFTLTVTGTNFSNGNVVRWNGSNRTTTFVSAQQLQASITAADIAAAGSASVTVFRAADSVTSSAVTFAINAASAPADFVDNFARADAADIGNGWIEKAPTAFSIAGGEAAKVSAGGNDYRNNIVYRPAAENQLDVEASIEARFLTSDIGYPNVAVRVQSSTVASANMLDAYLLYLNNSGTQALLARQRGGAYDTQLATFGVSPAINTTDRYRLRLRAVGTNPVVLNAFVERLVGSSWVTSGQATFNDVANDRIATAGSVGFGGYIETSYRFDNFTRTNLGAPAPAPTLTTLSPTNASAGSAPVNLTVTGTNFTPSSTIRWNGSDRATTYLSGTQLQTQIASTDLAAQGTASVTVFTPAPGGGSSNTLNFTITAPANNPVPVVTALNPATRSANSGAFTLTVNGSNFAPSAVVRWNGSSRTTTYVSANQVQAQINAADIAATGTANVTVFNPAPGGGTSGTIPFTVTAATNPVPTLTSIAPASATAGASAFTLTVNGSNFVSGSVVRWNGSNRTTSFVSATTLTAAISAADIAASGSNTVTVFTATPGGGTSAGQTFIVNTPSQVNPAPVLTQLSPVRANPGGSGFTLTLQGSGFTNQSVVRWNGVARTTTYISASEIRASISSGDIAAAGLRTVSVVTPAPGGGASTPLTFFVQDAAVNYFFDGFNRLDNEVIGNNWTEKNPSAFSIQDNRVISFVNVSGGFQQEIMTRPSGEDRMDGEVSVEFTRNSSEANEYLANFPQVHARVQRSTLTQPYSLDSYIFFIDDVRGDAMFAVTRSLTPGTRWECYIEALPLSEPLVVGSRYRLRFQVMGNYPVQLSGTVERYNDGIWQPIASGGATHDTSTQRDPSLYCDQPTMAPPINTGGGFGVAKWFNRTDNYDNFFWRDLAPGSAPPSISNLSPQAVNAGSAAFELTINGSGFTPGSVVRWNGANRTTTYVSANQVRAQISAADVASSGSAAVTVLATESGQTTAGMTFDIVPVATVENLLDTFQRTDGDAIGNGWLEKTPAAFSLVSGRAQKLATPGGDYRNNVVYRPAGENALNVEASMEFRITNASTIGFPAVMTRVQTDTVNAASSLDAYLMYLNDSPTGAVLARQRGNGYDTTLGYLNLSQPLNTVDTYRLRLRTTGTETVVLSAFVERLDGGNWVILGQMAVNDTSVQRISTPGSVGFGGYVENSYWFDNFRRLLF